MTDNCTLKSKDEQEGNGFLATIFTTFLTIFIAELGDKTQVATLLLSAESGQPFYVFIGAALALICSSLIGVLVGSWLSGKIPTRIFNVTAGSIMIVISLLLSIQLIPEISTLTSF